MPSAAETGARDQHGLPGAVQQSEGVGGGVRRGAGQLAASELVNRRHATWLLRVPRLLTGEGGSPTAAGRGGPGARCDRRRSRSLGRLRHRGLENPLLPLPAVLAVAVGFFAAPGRACRVLLLADRRRTDRPSLDDSELRSVLHRGSLSADAASLVLARRVGVRAHGLAELPLRLFRGGQGPAVTAAGLDPDRDHSILDQLSDPGSCLAQHVRGRGTDQPGADRHRPRRLADRLLRLRQAGDRDHLRLPAVPALLPRDLHRDRADQPGDAGCRRRPRRQAVAEVGHDNAPDRSLRHRCRLRLRLHRNDGRLRDAAADRRHQRHPLREPDHEPVRLLASVGIWRHPCGAVPGHHPAARDRAPAHGRRGRGGRRVHGRLHAPARAVSFRLLGAVSHLPLHAAGAAGSAGVQRLRRDRPAVRRLHHPLVHRGVQQPRAPRRASGPAFRLPSRRSSSAPCSARSRRCRLRASRAGCARSISG